jgi:hypothetical protein
MRDAERKEHSRREKGMRKQETERMMKEIDNGGKTDCMSKGR